MADPPQIPRHPDHTPNIPLPVSISPPEMAPRETKPIYIHSIPGTDVMTSFNLNLPGYENFNLPPAEELTEVTEEEWKDFMANSHRRTIVDGKLVPYERPAPPLSPMSQMYKAFTEGMKLVAPNNEKLNGAYPTNDTNWALITTELYLAQDSVTWADAAGQPHEFSRSEFVSFANVVAKWRSDWRKYAEGHAAEPPPETMTLP